MAPAEQGCNLAHVLGLFRMTAAPGAALALGARGALADIALWAIARLQTRVFASRTFAKCARLTKRNCARQHVKTCSPQRSQCLA